MKLLAARERPLTSPFVGLLIMLGAGMIALIMGAILMLLMSADPISGYRELFLGMAGSKHSIAESLVKTTPLLILALGIAVAFNTSVWNIGAEGQFYIGALFATWATVAFRELPIYLLWPITVFAGIATGGLWGGLVGYLRARFGINEIIVTVMMNYIAIFLMQYMVGGPLREKGSVGVGFPQTDVIPEGLWLPRILPGTRLHLGFLIALALAAAIYLSLKHTTLGYELRAVGKNPVAARYAGIDVGRMVTISMVISGGLAGLAGLIEVFGIHHRLLDGISPGYGFMAIIVALLGGCHPLWIVVAATLLASLDFGAHTMQRGIGIPVSLVLTIEYVTVILIVGSSILRTHEIVPIKNLLGRMRQWAVRKC
jgi:ABC-type uncharacterized transport system permease subunit